MPTQTICVHSWDWHASRQTPEPCACHQHHAFHGTFHQPIHAIKNMPQKKEIPSPRTERRNRLILLCVAGLATILSCLAYQKAYKTISPAADANQQSATTEWVSAILDATGRDSGQRSVNWHYLSHPAPGTSGQIRLAGVQSLNTIHLQAASPHPQRATLLLRTAPRQAPQVVLAVNHGQFQCIMDDCNIRVRFGKQDAILFRAFEPDTKSANTMRLRDGQKFLDAMQKVGILDMEASFYGEHNPHFQFNVSSFSAH